MALQTVVAAVLFIAWMEGSSELLARQQEPWLNVGIAAVTVSGALNALFLMEGRRAVSARRARAFATASLRTRNGSRPVLLSGVPAPSFGASTTMTRYHRPACPLASGKAIELHTRDIHESAGRRPCAICQP